MPYLCNVVLDWSLKRKAQSPVEAVLDDVRIGRKGIKSGRTWPMAATLAAVRVISEPRIDRN